MSSAELAPKKYQLFIDGQWVDAESGKTFATPNPATGETLAEVSEGDKADIDKAVAAAHRDAKPGSVVLPGSTVDKELEQDLDNAGIEGATVNCPDSVPVKEGTTVTCPVTYSSGRQGTISFQFSSSSGSIDSSSVEES